MEVQIARQIIDTLAQGIHPVTGESMAEDSPYRTPAVVRALGVASKALEAQEPKRSSARAAPPNAGKEWTAETDATLADLFDRGVEFKEIADQLGRTRFGVEQRLIKLGKLPTPGAGRFGSAA
jgi:hypothetical protein